MTEKKSEASPLAQAMFAIHKEIQNPQKTKTGSTGKREYKYADLPTLFAVLKPVCYEHGVWFVQYVDSGSEANFLTTEIWHESGEKMSCEIRLYSPDNPQDRGKEITYMRRYQLQCIFGVIGTEEDDDAQGYGGQKVAMSRAAKSAVQNGLAQKVKDAMDGLTGLQKQALWMDSCGRIPSLEEPPTDDERKKVLALMESDA